MTDLTGRRQWRALLWLALFCSLHARADVVDSINEVRAAGCAGGTRAAPLQRNALLDEVARRVAGGASLHSAEQQTGYHALSAFSVTIGDVAADGNVRHVTETQFCPQSTKVNFREIGVWREGSDVWVIMAEPVTPPANSDRSAFSDRVLQLINSARASARRCGPALLPPVPPLTRNATLEHAAQDYAQDMATFNYLDHTGRDGTAPHERITRSGYRWSETGENLASGMATPDAVVDGWLRSPEHCSNIMDPAYTQMGVGFAVNPHSDFGTYWALEFGRPLGK
jgi:uncharacterized protein YkwD